MDQDDMDGKAGEMHHNMLEQRVTKLEEGQTRLLSSTARIESLVESLSNGQKGVYNRMNRPWQWGVVIAAFAAMITLSTLFNQTLNLTVTPIAESVLALEEVVLNDRETYLATLMKNSDGVEEIRIASAVNAESIRWLGILEQRGHRHTETLERESEAHRFQNGDAH